LHRAILADPERKAVLSFTEWNYCTFSRIQTAVH
jgi:phage-related baseplate assembly protein